MSTRVVTAAEWRATLPADIVAEGDALARVWIAEELSLRDLRKAQKRTQQRVAKDLGIAQEGVSRIEQRTDLLLTTLRGYVQALGGTLRLIVEFPGRPPVEVTGLAAEPTASRGRARRTRAAATKRRARPRRAG